MWVVCFVCMYDRSRSGVGGAELLRLQTSVGRWLVGGVRSGAAGYDYLDFKCNSIGHGRSVIGGGPS